jgi:2-alkyl-3-oxoalkanoate reductase
MRRWNPEVATMSISSPSIQRIAIIGAGGYVGARFMHVLRHHGSLRGVGVVRSAKSLARLSNAPMETRVVNTSKASELAKALSGCETVVNAINGDVSRILSETQTVYEAVHLAGCKLLIHLSSAVVFGRAESAALHDDSEPEVRNWMLYARGKAETEVYLRRVTKDSGARVVVLRPGLIWGPGSHWVSMVADQLMLGTACLSNSGAGIANLIYVDNLIRMMLAVQGKAAAGSGFYNVGDPEVVTWSQYYGGIARRIGYPGKNIRTWPNGRLPFSVKLAVEWGLQRKLLYRLAKWVLPRMGANTKVLAKRVLQGEPRPPEPAPATLESPPRLTREHWSLQNTCLRLPTVKFTKDYGPVELIPFEEALDAAAAWLRFAGYVAGPYTAVSSAR